MRAVVQRVKRASVKVSEKEIGRIESGFLVLIAFAVDDREEMLQKMADKIVNLRIMEDAAGKMNISLREAGGEVLLVSQFTLYGDCANGNRPSFIKSARPEKAEPFYEKLIEILHGKGLTVATGQFGGYMEIELVNDGPTTVIIDI